MPLKSFPFLTTTQNMIQANDTLKGEKKKNTPPPSPPKYTELHIPCEKTKQYWHRHPPETGTA